MITQSERIKLKELLKHNYVADVLLELEKFNVLNTKGEPHSESIIRNVFAGYQCNVDIEDAILRVYAHRKTLLAQQKQKKNKLLSA